MELFQRLRCLIVTMSLVTFETFVPCHAESPSDSMTGEELERDQVRLGNLSRISIAMRSFDDKHGHFPKRVSRSPNGKPLLSWRVALLPFLGHEDLHRQFRHEEPWDSEHNRELVRQMPDVFDVGVYFESGKDASDGYTHAVVPVMEGSVWHGEEGQERTIYDVQDGSAYTLAAFVAPDDAAVVWTKPDDLAMAVESVGHDMFGGRKYCLITTFDGAKYRIANSTSNADLKALITFDGAEELSWNRFMPWLKEKHTSNPPRTNSDWSMGLAANTTDTILEKRLRRKPDITWLSLGHTQVTAHGLRHLKGLPAIKVVYLNDSQATDIGLEHLAEVSTLESLDLRDAPVTDVGLSRIGKLSNLKKLFLDRTSITDDGLSDFGVLKALEDLRLDDTRVTDAGLAHLQGLTTLEKLSLSDTDVTDRGLAHLKRLTNLKSLILTRTLVVGPGLEHLQGMTKLEWLHLDQTPVNAASLAHLKSLESLKSLNARLTSISQEAAREQKALWPGKCYVSTQLLDWNEPTNMSYALDLRSGATATIHEGIWKLYARSTGSLALFDLSTDLRERNDVATDHPDTVKRLLAKLRQMISMGTQSAETKEWLRHHSQP
ncbi:MAG: DUF1559 domain-containing protein [Planctomycetales bacterium]|nr:DUF1559 domain-containing protein [Planctomycetales bacterium]